MEIDWYYVIAGVLTAYGLYFIFKVILAPFKFVYKLIIKNKHIVCAWCNSKSIKFIEGEEGTWFWEYRNKDGSKDKRAKDNFQRANYVSLYNCKNCHAYTVFGHFASTQPSKNVDVCSRTLAEPGEGTRCGYDWESDGGEPIDIGSENRKGR